ncbi:MAG: MBL fold metallo-hydrolase [Mariprofundaceae bacterium]|nr:MBL fold metallo-hydrolase [Mariprofundaceae bacterium]
MIFRQLFDHDTWTYTYLLADEKSKEAVLIDPVLEKTDRDLQLLEELGLTLKYALDTHVHADHITANGQLRERTGCQTAVSAKNEVDCIDLHLKDGDSLTFGALKLDVLETPGHTGGCLSFVCEDKVFTGDALMIRACGRTDFQQGDAATLYHSITQKLFQLGDDKQVYPGHDYKGMSSSTIAEEKEHNPRIRLGREGFIDFMEHLDLANPKKIHEAVPANMDCGFKSSQVV